MRSTRAPAQPLDEHFGADCASVATIGRADDPAAAAALLLLLLLRRQQQRCNGGRFITH